MTVADVAHDILLGVLAFFALLALVTVVRVIFNRESTAWRRMRVGFFVERDRPDRPEDDDRPGWPK